MQPGLMTEDRGVMASILAGCAVTIKANLVAGGISQFWQEFYDRNVDLFLGQNQ